MKYDRDTCRECGTDLEAYRQRSRGLCAGCSDGVIQK